MGEPIITIELPKSQAEFLLEGMDNFLCWAAGFKAARPGDDDKWPQGEEEARELRGLIKDALGRPF